MKITGIYGSKRRDPQFNPNSDLDDDGEIEIYDVVMCKSLQTKLVVTVIALSLIHFFLKNNQFFLPLNLIRQ